MFTAVNLLGSFIFLLSVAGTYHVTGTLAMRDVAERMLGVAEGTVRASLHKARAALARR